MVGRCLCRGSRLGRLAVGADGRIEARVRQLPGPGNPMGRIKFMFPNDRGIYLHDTPEKGLLREDDRLFSSGCVRLKDAPRLARWLFGRPVAMARDTPEQRVDLPEPVPVYITYQTTAPAGGKLLFRRDGDAAAADVDARR